MVNYCRLLIVLSVVVLTITACANVTDPNPALPQGLTQATVPNSTVNAYVYVRPDSSFAIEGDASEKLISLAVAASDLGDFAWQPRYVGAASSTSWESGVSSPIFDILPAFTSDLQLAPVEPPKTPFAVGFVRNVGELIDTLIASTGAVVPSLSDALALVRINEITFIGYANEITLLPTRFKPNQLSELDASVLAIATSNYPSAIVGQVFESFATALALTPIDIDGHTAYARTISPDIDLAVLRQDPTLYFAITPTRTQTEALLASVPRR